MKKYYVSRDYQGGNFGMSYGAQSALEWVETVAGWLEDDDAFDEGDDWETFVAEWTDKINSDPKYEDEFMDWVSDWWELEFTEEDNEIVLRDYNNESDIVYDAKLVSMQERTPILIVKRHQEYFGVLTSKITEAIDIYKDMGYEPRGWVEPSGRAFEYN